MGQKWSKKLVKQVEPEPLGVTQTPQHVLHGKSVMWSQKFTTPPKGKTHNTEAHCVQR